MGRESRLNPTKAQPAMERMPRKSGAQKKREERERWKYLTHASTLAREAWERKFMESGQK